MLLSDKDTLMNGVQASHDAHTAKIDALEDKLINNEVKSATSLVRLVPIVPFNYFRSGCVGLWVALRIALGILLLLASTASV